MGSGFGLRQTSRQDLDPAYRMGYTSGWIGDAFGCTGHNVRQACVNPGRGVRVARRQFRARVWSRLWGPEFRMTQREIGKIWRVSNVLVCREISELRYFTPVLAA